VILRQSKKCKTFLSTENDEIEIRASHWSDYLLGGWFFCELDESQRDLLNGGTLRQLGEESMKRIIEYRRQGSSIW
jgi:hypothetical protein